MIGFLMGLGNVLMVLTSLFLICLVLIQRGKGAVWRVRSAAWGSSAFGTKAGDVFTRVTIYVAIFWFILAMGLVIGSNSAPTSAFSKGLSAESPLNKEGDADAKGADKGAGPVDKDKDKGKPAPNDKGAAPAKPPVDKGLGKGSEPAKPADTKTPEPAKPADAGLKPTSDTPDPAKKP